jgi:hypothetical protein
MICYRDMTFCKFYEDCKHNGNCGRELTPEIISRAANAGLWISQFAQKPDCWDRREPMKDFLGNEIQIGDTIVYPGRQGSTMWMNIAEVVGIDYDQQYVHSPILPVLHVRRDNGKMYDVYRIDRVVVIPELECTLKVLPKKKSLWSRIWNWRPSYFLSDGTECK